MENSKGSGRVRISSIDVVRGAVMALMALDHVRDYVTERTGILSPGRRNARPL